LRAKFTNDSNFFVREVGRGRGVLERSLEIIAEVWRGGGSAELSVVVVQIPYFTVYRAMHFSTKRGIAIVCCPSVRLSVCL